MGGAASIDRGPSEDFAARVSLDDEVRRAIEVLQRVVESVAEPDARRALDEVQCALAHARRRAHTDPLTGLMNRASFADALAGTLARPHVSPRFAALLFLDLDGFKQINDSFGHHVGDILLAEAASRIAACVREGDLIARYGGDEFLVLLEQVADEHTVRAVSSRLVAALGAPYFVSGCNVPLGVSIGVALFPHHADGPADLMQLADYAMYRAKQEGGDRYVLFDGQEPASMPRTRSGTVAKHALESHPSSSKRR
jgi:diguanylate cyclase (GGDEF)-like protein